MLLSLLVAGGCGEVVSGIDRSKVVEGKFVDSPVSGLRYVCDYTFDGVTDYNGKFECFEGDNVTFYLGEYKLGTARVAEVISPFSLYPESDSAAINVAQLLQTVDSDGNPSNGITPDMEKVALLEGSEVTPENDKFDRLMTYLIGEQLVSYEDAKIHLMKSMDYAGQKFPDFFVLTSYKLDSSCDGTVDYSREVDYNEFGQPVRENLYRDGVEDRRLAYAYDFANRLLSMSSYYLASGASYKTNYFYDIKNNITSVFNDYGIDGEDIQDIKIKFVYDQYGNIIEETSYQFPFDSSYSSVISEYDDEGNVLKNILILGGNIDKTIYYEYDSNNNMTKMAYDNDMDGVIDDEKLYEYNEDNRIVMQLVNRDLSRFFYDEKGLLVKKTTDYLNDGYVDNHSLYFYDGDGNVIREEDHYGSVDNPPGLIINYLYDEHGNLIESLIDDDVDGTPDRCRYREWLKI
jgi:hypothetical protein